MTLLFFQPKYSKTLVVGNEEGREDPADWEECEDEEGHMFYHNGKTGESRWVKPKFKTESIKEVGSPSMMKGWEELEDEAGNTYYFCEATKVRNLEF